MKLVTQEKFEKLLHCHAISDHSCPFWSIFVHFMGNPTASLDWIFIKSSMICILHIKSFLNPTSPTFLAQFVTEPLIKHGLFPWIKVDKSHHHQPYRLGVRVVTLWCRSWLIIINLCKYSLEHTAMKILSECHDILMSFYFEPPLMRIHLKTYQNNGFLNR